MTRAGLAVGVLADDLTGALGSAARLRDAGLRTAVRWDRRPLRDDVDALVVDMRTRDYAVPRDSVQRWADTLRGCGCRWAELRIDSTLRGAPADELADLLTGLDRHDAAVLAVPAFPGAGRSSRNGRLTVNGVDAGLDTAGVLFPGERVERLGIEVIEQGAGAAFDWAITSWNSGARRLLADATTDDHLRVLADMAYRLSTTLDGGLISMSPGAWLRYLTIDRASGYVLVVLSSATTANHQQLERLRRDPDTTVVSALELLRHFSDGTPDDRPVGSRPDRAVQPLRPVIVVETLTDAHDGTRTQSALAAEAAHLLLAARRRQGAHCIGVVVSGGQTGSALMDELGAAELLPIHEVAPLCPLGQITGGAWSGLPIVTKGGLIGNPGTLTELVATVWRRQRD